MKINRIIEHGAKFFAGVCVLALLNACSGAVSSASDPAIPFSISPSTATAYSGVPTTLTISGGGLRAPFLVVSSNATLLPVTFSSVSGTLQIVITPGTVTAQQSGTVTVADATGAQSTATINVLPNLVNGDITVTGTAPPAFPDCTVTGTVCAGQSGTATLTVSQNGAPAKGRSVRFDVVQGTYQFPVDVAQSVFSNSVTVTSDESGKVTTVLRANVGSSPQIATIKATDVATGAFRTATFLIKQAALSGGDFVTVPPEWLINGAFKSICPGGTVDYLIFGGTPPYTIRSSAPLTASAFPTVTPNENPSRFSVNFQGGACGSEGYQAIMTVTDSVGLTIPAKLTVKPGTEDQVLPPTITLSPQSLTLGCGQQAQVLVTVANPPTTASSFTTSIGVVASPSSSFTATVGPGATSTTGGVITVTRSAGPNTVSSNPAPVYVGSGSAATQAISVTTPLTCP